MVQLGDTNLGITIATARPMECVFNTMPQALFHRARPGNEEMSHFFTQKLTKIKRIGYSHIIMITSDMNELEG